MTTGLMFPLQHTDPEKVVPFGELVAGGLAGRLWLGQSVLAETHQTLAYLAGRGLRVPCGLGVTLMPLRHPMEAAAQARSLAALTGRPLVAGYGTATPDLVQALRGAPYRRPAAAAADYARAVRAFLDGDAALPPMSHPPVEVGLGVLRPGMARAAGAAADVAVTWMTPPRYLAETLIPALAEGAGGRGGRPRVVTVVHVAPAARGRDPRRLAYGAAADHLRAPHYTDMLRRAGVPADPADPRAGAAALVEAGVYAYGPVEDVVARLRGYREAGADEVVLNLAGVAALEGFGAALADAEALLHALADAGG
ncbi:LLM class flavin-dependent oxidoreductase [Actinomadura sp. ATCC 31491]|uniref:LLM class flavin-dependent oxidoreductase n=1 Tax=Actinomadura luzonensis TaxID=2805427 RepID=A0ABT0FMY7_9ACTN|nr:LLM class flavin-dependent oxidoreductase [Actinomadura luzonensis]MCK2213714.1 LLM class flavin-dependent oxidoreductase [Actinomadura luzonensis]